MRFLNQNIQRTLFIEWTKKYTAIIIIFSLIQSSSIQAQNDTTSFMQQCEYGILTGLVTDKKHGEAIPFANITLKKNGVTHRGTASNLDGFFTLNTLDRDIYDIEISFVQYECVTLSNIDLKKNRELFIKVELGRSNENFSGCPTYLHNEIPLDRFTSGKTYKRGRDF